MKNIFMLLAMYLLSPSSLLSQDYLWPTNASNWLTATFGESRSRRPHAAIDIKTWNKTGYKIFATRDGYVSRIRVSPFGYGKALYLTLDTGEIVVYAHLEGFVEGLNEIVIREQDKKGRYRVNKYLKSSAYPVKKGDVLGFTGETGIGVPHLHFEMRDAQNRPINPLSKGFKIKDTVAPIPLKFVVIPLNHSSRINDDFKPQFFKIVKKGPGRFVIPEPFSFEGRVGLGISSYDMSGGVHNKFQVYELRLLIDNKFHFAVKYDRFSYTYAKHAIFDRDYRLARKGFGRINRLFQVPENKLGVYKYANRAKGALIYESDAGIAGQKEQLLPGVHSFRIELRDYKGNLSTIDGKFNVEQRFLMNTVATQQDSALLIEGFDMNSAAKSGFVIIERAKWKHGAKWAPWDTLDFATNGKTAFDGIFPVNLPLYNSAGTGMLYRAQAVIPGAARSWPTVLAHGKSIENRPVALNMELSFFDDYARIAVTSNQPLWRPPFIEITLGDGSTVYPTPIQKDAETYLVIIPLTEITGLNNRIVAQGQSANSQIGIAELLFDNTPIQKGRVAHFYAADSMLRVDFKKSSLYKNIYMRVRKDKERSGRQKKFYSGIYNIEPGDVPMDYGAMVSIKYDSTVADPTKLGVYYLIGQKRWVFIDNKLDAARQEVSARVLSFEKFALRIDEQPPVVEFRTPSRKRALVSDGTIRVYAKDALSGFASEESFALTIDGENIIGEYDPENHIIDYKPRNPLTSGRHKLKFVATDKCGNRKVVQKDITIK